MVSQIELPVLPVIDDPRHAETRERLDGLMRTPMESIGDDLRLRDSDFQHFGIEFDPRWKVADFVGNIYGWSG